MQSHTEHVRFYEKHREYIDSCTEVRSIEIANFTGRYSDVDDYRQEIRLYIFQKITQYQPKHAKPHTFINLLAVTAKRKMLRRLRKETNNHAR